MQIKPLSRTRTVGSPVWTDLRPGSAGIPCYQRILGIPRSLTRRLNRGCACAFRGCTWTRDLNKRNSVAVDREILQHWGQEWTLFTHLLDSHSDAFEEELQFCGVTYRPSYSSYPAYCERPREVTGKNSQSYLFLRVISNYLEAVRVREREDMPKIGVAVDRRTLRHMSFDCAQIFVYVPLWERMYEPHERGLHGIEADSPARCSP